MTKPEKNPKDQPAQPQRAPADDTGHGNPPPPPPPPPGS